MCSADSQAVCYLKFWDTEEKGSLGLAELGTFFRATNQYQRIWGKMLRSLEGNVFQFVPGVLCISEALINVC